MARVIEVIARREKVGVPAREYNDVEVTLLLDPFHQYGTFNDGGRIQKIDRRVGVDHLPVAGDGFADLEQGQAADVEHPGRPACGSGLLGGQLGDLSAGRVDELCVGVGVSPQSPATFDCFGEEHPDSLRI